MNWILDPNDPAIAAWRRGDTYDETLAEIERRRASARREMARHYQNLKRARRAMRLGDPLTDSQAAALKREEEDRHAARPVAIRAHSADLGLSGVRARRILRECAERRRQLKRDMAGSQRRAATMDGSNERQHGRTQTPKVMPSV